jgi:S-methylmethionine-dependent homocysteine/selenocysteine methylase
VVCSERTLAVTLEQCSSVVRFLQAAMVMVCRCTNFIHDPAVVPMVAVMAMATKAMLVATEGQTLEKEQKAESKNVALEMVTQTPALTVFKEDL